MATPLHLEFQGTTPSPAVRSIVEEHFGDLERRYGRMTSCRVVVKHPGNHHRHGGPYEVHVRLALPDGREVNVGRVAHDDERFGDVTFAVNDAFKRARRRLQDKVRRLRGEVKQRVEPPLATVARIDESGEFGFLTADDGREIYFHRNSVVDGAFDRLEPGARVSFAESTGDQGPQASTVKPLGKHGLKLTAEPTLT